MNQEEKKREWLFLVICTFDMHIYTTHMLSWEWIREEKKREWLFLVICTFDMHIYTTHRLKLGMDQRREKEGVVIVLRLTCTSTQLTG